MGQRNLCDQLKALGCFEKMTQWEAGRELWGQERFPEPSIPSTSGKRKGQQEMKAKRENAIFEVTVQCGGQA